ncbi:macro domain-containing protein [Paenibacillus campi]|uniref:type II toxin-antitoxin system antitoxin DNA ADP-ribosyl glycohydrolase DarG n=1 Tax=Paenibacillus campi TaxID=3106031 RepID=UPI002AFE2CA4|nr:macro domain-containing protein [Paenibacillus sp. SGZ-1009]
MIEYKQGNLLQADLEALINTVNCVGVMGKGIALQFKQTFPENFKQYEKACKLGKVVIGEMFVVSLDSIVNPRYIINFPTKAHWKEKSKLSYIESGLENLIKTIKKYEIKSIAVPPLGCGNGGLDWKVVQPLIESAANQLPDVHFVIYPPTGSPNPDEIIVRTSTPKLTRSRSLLILLMSMYEKPGYKLSLLEIQKLAYFLQECGETLRLNFVKAQYGPYAENLNHVLQRLEGHYIRGYGDRNRESQIYILSNAIQEVEGFISEYGDNKINELLDAVNKIIEGFETPYGLELLATTDWIIKHNEQAKSDMDYTVSLFKSWNKRKEKLFSEKHIQIAWKNLVDLSIH